MPSVATDEPRPAQPLIDTFKVRVNGKEVEVPKTMPDPVTGKPLPTTMIQACALAQVDVPHYCYSSPNCRSQAICRMCLVEFGTPAIGPDRKPIPEPGWGHEDRESAAPGYCVCHADFSRHGNLHRHAGR